MSKLKVLISNGAGSLEIEGEDAQVVSTYQDIFANYRDIVFPQSDLFETEPTFPVPATPEDAVVEESAPATAEEDVPKQAEGPLPSLSQVIRLGRPKTETEWCLIYSLYCDQEMGPFKESDILEKYRSTGRYTIPRRNNLRRNMQTLVKRGLLQKSGTAFAPTPDGEAEAHAILNREAEEKSKPSSAKKYEKYTYSTVELNLTPRDGVDFQSFWSSHHHTSHLDQAVLISYWLKERKGIFEISADHLFTLLRTVGENTSFDIKSVLPNARRKRNFFTYGSQKGFYAITHIGEDHVKDIEIR